MTRTAWGLDAGSDEHWSTRGACRTGDPEGWTDVRNTGWALALANKRAVLTCRRCPVVEACRAFGECLDPFDRRGQIIGGVVYGRAGDPATPEQVEMWLTRPSMQAIEAKRAAKVPKPSKGPSRPPAECGTAAGYARHHRRHEAICEPCRAANTAKGKEYRKARAAVLLPRTTCAREGCNAWFQPRDERHVYHSGTCRAIAITEARRATRGGHEAAQ